MRYGIHCVIVLAALSLGSAGCATVDWTEELFAKRQVEVDDHFTKVETEVRQQGQRIDQVEVRIAKLDDRLTETRGLVQGAGTPAPPVARATTATAAAPRPTTDRPSGPARTLITVVHVPFGFDRADLDPAAEAALAPILKELRRNAGLAIDLEGATDAVGGLDYNVKLSQRRVEAVRRWLVGQGVDRARIVGSTARGPLFNVAVKDDLKRRVTVKLMSVGE
jgi:outer membrane protein OmpA-like peptidoglycan-associated protein